MTTERQGVDARVSELVAGTNGLAYLHLVGRLDDYPIPDMRLPRAQGALLLDVGCSWGRWSIAAARLGYLPVGIDPAFESVQAAKQVASELGLKALFVVGDARALPFRAEAIDVAYSYSVLQHFSTADVGTALCEMDRVLKPGGKSLVQMATAFGIRCLYHQIRRGFREAVNFEVRYRRIGRLKEMFTRRIGPSRLSVDCFFGLGIQESDIRMMPLWLRVVFRTSGLLRRASRTFPWLMYVADSVYIESTKPLN